MVVVSYSGKEINAKLVYYGAGLSGKTTNLEAIYEAVPDTSRGKMVSMKTQSDRTLFFDLLPLDLGEIMGFKTRFLLYTVPGQVFYNATRKLVLKGADAIVFVADSEVGKMEENKESLQNLRTNLAEYNVQLDTLPWVIQYNKRDLPNVYSVDELNAELNPGGKVPFFESVAREGKGVFETFRGISHLLMEKVTRDLRRTPSNERAREETPTTREMPRTPMGAPPMAPAQAIRVEAQATPAPVAEDGSTRIDYGREIELPGMIPAVPVANAVPSPFMAPATPAPVAAAAQPQPVAVHAPAAPAPAPVAAPVAAQPAPARVVAPAPTPAPVAAAPVAATPTPAPAPVHVAPVNIAPQPAAPQASTAPETARPQQLVVPITLPRGGTYEIVLRIQVE